MARERYQALAPKSLDSSARDLWRDDPSLFCRDVLGYDPWNKQAEFLTLVAQNDFTAVRSGHKCSKSRSLASLGHWWIATRPQGKVVLTAPSHHQVANILWPEFSLLHQNARIPLGGRLYTDSHKGLQHDDGRRVFGVTTDSPERLAGISGAELLILVDEASGYPENLFDAIFGNLAGGGKVVLAGNPTRTSGLFYDAFYTKRDEWKTLHISSLDTPNFHGGDIPGLAHPKWVEKMRGVWGEGTPMWDVRILGKFPTSSENQVISLDMLDNAYARMESGKVEKGGRIQIGVDPARFGDDESTISAVRGLEHLGTRAFHGLDGPQLALNVIEYARQLRVLHPGPHKVSVRIDPIGVGASPTDVLRQFDEIELHELDAGSSSTTYDYARLRDELWFGIRTWFEAGGALLRDEKLGGELVAPTYSLDMRNRIKVEGKDDLRKRLRRSPDRADSLALAVFQLDPIVMSYPTPHISHFETQGIG